MSAHGRTHWIKLYVEMLDDPKVGLLPDAVKWRWVSVLLQAGELNEGGFLPDVNDMAWRLHTNVETLQGEMRTLAGRGLVELKEYHDGSERWFVTAFEKRQAAATSTERSQMHRHKKRQNSGDDGDGTGMQRNVAKKSHNTEYRIQNTETEGEGAAGKQYVRATAPAPTIIERAPLAVRYFQEFTSYYPGEAVTPAIVKAIGESPDKETLRRAVELWRFNGYKITHWAGMCDYYNELKANPNWTPNPRKGSAATPEDDTLWQRALQAISAGRIDDERLKAAIRAIGGTSAIKQANEYTARQLKERLGHEYRLTATA